MLVVVEKALEEQLNQFCTNATVVELRGITNLLQAHADGHHIVVAHPSICRIWEESSRLSEEHRAAAKKIRLRYSEMASLRDVLPVFSEVRFELQEPTRNGKVWLIPLHWIATNGLSQSHLVCEDLHDCTIGHEAARDYLGFTSLAKLKLSLDHTAGGGVNTARVLREKAVNSQRISVCVLDSDREEPVFGKIGATAQACLEIGAPGLYEIVLTPGRELENHLPIRLVDRVRGTWHSVPPSQIHAQFGALHPDIMLFADLKSGLKRKNITLMKDSVHVYWDNAFTALGQTPNCCASGCAANSSGDCKHQVIEPLGRALLRDTGDYLTSTSHNPIRHQQYLPSPNDGFWKGVGGLIASYGVSVKSSAI